MTCGPYTSVRGRKGRGEELLLRCLAKGLVGSAHAGKEGEREGKRWAAAGLCQVGLAHRGKGKEEGVGRGRGPEKRERKESETVSHFPFMKFPFYFQEIN